MCTILGEGHNGHHPHVLSLLAYADDILVPVASARPADLVKQLQQLMSCLWRTFTKYQLRLNCGPRKTEVCLHLESRSAKPILQFLRLETEEKMDPSLRTDPSSKAQTQIHIPFDQGWVRTVTSYHYLGRWASTNTNPSQDFAVQRACAVNAFHQHQRVLTSK
eukprot:6472382-Amphidinium_carterae.1